MNDEHKSPNCIMKKVVYQKPYLVLFCVRNIAAGEEIRYSYGQNVDAPWRKCNKGII